MGISRILPRLVWLIIFPDSSIRQAVVSAHENCAPKAASGALLRMDFGPKFLLDP
jgi:hypothetical protein